MIVFWAHSQVHNIIWAMFKQSEDVAELQSLHPKQPMKVWHFCFYCGLFLSDTCVGICAWSLQKVVANRWSVINLPKMKITFYLGAVLTQPVLKTQGKGHSFAKAVQNFVLSTACYQPRQRGQVSWPLHSERQSGFWLWLEGKRASVRMHNVFSLKCLGWISPEP